MSEKEHMNQGLRIGALISGSGTNLQAILDACKSGAISGRVVFVGSDNPAATGLQRATDQGIPTFVVDYGAIIRKYTADPTAFNAPQRADVEMVMGRQQLMPEPTDPAKRLQFFSTRIAAEAELLSHMDTHRFDLLVLAGFMRNLTPYFIDRINSDPFHPRIMNIHPALLPAFPGVDGYGDTFRYGCRIGGCTVHFIDYGEDTGPIIGQKAFAIEETDSLDTVRKKGLVLEWQLYPECIQLFADGRLRVIETIHALKNGTEVRRKTVRIHPSHETTES